MATTIDVTKENGTFYTWDSANFGWNDTQADKTWNNAANTLAAVNVGEPYAISDVMRPNINKRLLESIHVADTMKTSLQILRKDVLSIGETYWDNINFALKIAESFVVNELRKATITAIRKDQINFTEKVIKNDHKYFYEIFATQEAAIRTLNKITKESFHLLESSSQAVTFLRTLAEGLAINEVLNKNVQYTREFAETLSVVQTYWDNIAFALRLMEGIGIGESEANTADFHRTIAESLAIADVMNHTIARLVMILETLGISDFGGRTVDYKRTVLENIGTADLDSQAVTFKRLFAELIKAQALNAPAITSPTFTRASTAYKQDGSVVAAGEPRFERISKNMWNAGKESCYVLLKTDNIYCGLDNDTRTTLYYKFQQWAGQNFIGTAPRPVCTVSFTGIYSLTTTIVAGATRLRLANNGAVREFSLFLPIPSDLNVGDVVTISFEIVDATIGSSKFTNVQLEKGAVATAYEPYQLGVMVEEGTVNLASGALGSMAGKGLTYTYIETLPDGYKKYAISGTWVGGAYPYSAYFAGPNMTLGTSYSSACDVYTNVPEKFTSEFGKITIVNATSSTPLVFERIGNHSKVSNFTPTANISTNSTYLRSQAISDGTVFNPETDFLYARNFQCVAKSYTTSYHPTARSSEAIIVPASTLSVNEGTIQFDFVPSSYGLANRYIVNMRDANQTNVYKTLGIQVSGITGNFMLLWANGTVYYQPTSDVVVAPLIKYRIGLRFDGATASLWINGVKKVEVSGYVFELGNTIWYGSRWDDSSGGRANGCFSNIHHSSIARSDEEMSYTGPLVIDANTTYFAPLTEDLDASVYESGEIVKDVEKPLAEAISASESNSKGYGLKKSESFAAADVVKKTAGKKILETLHFAETYWDNVNFALRILEAFAIQEGQHRNITHSAKETLGVGEFVSKHDRKFTFENIVAQERNLKATTKKLSETLTTIDATTQIVNFLRTIAETLHVAEAPAQAVDFHRLFAEAAHMADSYKSAVTKLMAETLKVGRKRDTIANLVTNGDFSNGTTGWSGSSTTKTSDNDKLYATASNVSHEHYVEQSYTSPIAGHKYYAAMDVTLINCHGRTYIYNLKDTGSYEASYVGIYNTSGRKSLIHTVSTVSATTPNLLVRFTFLDTSNNQIFTGSNEQVILDNIILIDLTAMFGAGNEPTLAECDVLFENYYRAEQAVEITQPHAETLHVTELPSKNLATLRKEALHIAETYWDNIAFIVRCLENIHVGEVIRNTSSFKRTWNESVALNENAARINEFNRLWQEAFGTTEGYANAVHFIRKTYETLWVNEGPKKNTAKALQDAFAISDLAAKLVGKPLQEALRVTDKKSVNMAKLLQDTLHMVDFIDRNIAFVRKFFETFGTSDKISRNVETLLRENFSMADKVRNTYQKAVSENFAIASDTFSRQVDFKLKIEEIISSIEGVAMEYGLEINEAINLLDSYITNVKAVLSNIAIREGEMTLADFQDAIATPPGYNTFRDFVVGDYEYQKALMRIVINAPATSSQPVVKDVVPYVDIEDTDDKGEVTITQTTTATKVYFNKFYYNAPEVNVTLKGGSGVIIPNIVSTTGQDEGGRYFEVELLNSSGSRVTGTFSWTSKGY